MIARRFADGDSDVRHVLMELRALGSEAGRAGMARFGINVEKAFGVSMAAQRPLQRKYRRNHGLAGELWASGFHEARILAALIDDAQQVTRKQMDDWVADFNSWDLCDQACMKLFAKTPYVSTKVVKWAKDRREFIRRAAFATIAGYAVAAKKATDAEFMPYLALIERYADDERNFVRKAVNWALRQIGKRSQSLHGPALALAKKLAASENKTERWIGRDAVKELTDPAQIARIARRGR